jgi:hypothetical protein
MYKVLPDIAMTYGIAKIFTPMAMFVGQKGKHGTVANAPSGAFNATF